MIKRRKSRVKNEKRGDKWKGMSRKGKEGEKGIIFGRGSECE